MEKGLITLIVPCYNVGKTLERFLQSVLKQTYRHIQIVFIDDGSTDNTATILKKYQPIFSSAKMKMQYIYQKNAGLGSAINTGLKYIEGEYLCWADPDDFYMKDSMEKRINILKKNEDYAIVTSDAYYYRFNDLNNPIKKASEGMENCFDEKQFEYLLNEKSIFCPGCHMIRVSALKAVNPKCEIYPARRGQNWQLLLPIYYKYKRFFLDEPLYGYVIYAQSMSQGDVTKEKVLERWEEHEKILNETLKRMNMDSKDLEKYLKMVQVRYIKKRFFTAIDYKDKKLIKQQYNLLKINEESRKELKLLYYRNEYLIIKILCKVLEKIKKRNKLICHHV